MRKLFSFIFTLLLVLMSFNQAMAREVRTEDPNVFTNVNIFNKDVKFLGPLKGASPIILEGATENAYETTFAVTDPTADRTFTIPNKTGQAQMASAASVITPGTTPTLTVSLSNLYTDTPTDNENQTITFSGAGTAGDEITIVFICVGTADEVITFHATLVSSTGTLTCDTTAARYYVVRFISDGTHWYEVSRTAVQT